jgi:hypothetical protein
MFNRIKVYLSQLSCFLGAIRGAKTFKAVVYNCVNKIDEAMR